MNQLLETYRYLALWLESMLYKVFTDDGRRYEGDYPEVDNYRKDKDSTWL